MKKQKNKVQEAVNPPQTPVKRIVLPARWLTIFSVVVPLLAAIAGALYWLLMRGAIGEIGLPFDDSWIPLTFAKNLLAHGSYAYHSAGMATSGATAPLQVLLLALLGVPLGVGISASFVLGMLSFVVAAYALFRLALYVFDEDQRYAVAAALLFVLSPLSVSAAMSGLPSMLFTALILLSAMFYVTRKPLWFFVFAGLSLWVRPDGLIFLIAALLHLLYNHAFARAPERSGSDSQPASKRDTMIGAVLGVVLIAGYGLFNLSMSGSFFPNSVAAKLKYYSAASSDFWGDVFRFYSSSAQVALVAFAALAALVLLWNVIRRRQQPLFMAAAFIAGTVLAGWLIFPFVLSMHTLFATLPFFLLLSLWGIRAVFQLLSGLFTSPPLNFIAPIFAVIAVGAALVFSLNDWDDMRVVHNRMVRGQLERSVAAADWVSHNSSASTTIATHFPGALGFYTECRIVDMTGVVSPEVIPNIGDLPALVGVMNKENVEMIVAQRDHFEVVNVSPFWASNRNAPPIMEIHPYITGKTHLMSQMASSLNMQAAALMQEGRSDEALELLQKSYEEDSESARTNTLLGLILLEKKDTAKAEEHLRKAMALDPEYSPAMVPLGDILVSRKDFLNGIPILEEALRLNPSSTRARASWRNALRAQREDSLAAKGIRTFTITQ